MFVFMDVLRKLPAIICLDIKSISQPAVSHKGDREKTEYAVSQAKYNSGVINRREYMRSLSLCFMAKVCM